MATRGLPDTGAAPSVAVLSVLSFRLFSFWLPILPGFLAFGTLRRHDLLQPLRSNGLPRRQVRGPMGGTGALDSDRTAQLGRFVAVWRIPTTATS